ncbi:hypothetical protein [Yinghuangia soli]|uniref:Uncharacterized protein n=1 Tax=Yinghuangia soli TaxID=2908204 RepID=A0AA41Q0A0_9ACTN|nr:hypothetical protein [Yinghuangia soli]MCF2529113.1 hypothetical protein [Yinghuangia soli]
MNCFGGPGTELELTNGGTEVFVEVMMLAVSATAGAPSEYRFAALMAAQDQNMRGRGCVGFDLDEITWGPTADEQARVRRFILDTVDLAASGHRWSELGYEPPYALDYLRRFRGMVEAFTPPLTPPLAPPLAPPLDRTPPTEPDDPDDPALATCLTHRVLALGEWGGTCVFCTR